MTTKPTTEPQVALYAALVAAQAEMPRIAKSQTATVKTKGGGEFHYSYLDIAAVLAAVRPVLARHRLGIIQHPECNDGRLTVETLIIHADGGSDASSLSCRVNDADPQAMGSAITYLRRYGALCALGIAPEDEDDDGGAATRGQPQPKPRQARKPADSDAEATIATDRELADFADELRQLDRSFEAVDEWHLKKHGKPLSACTFNELAALLDFIRKTPRK